MTRSLPQGSVPRYLARVSGTASTSEDYAEVLRAVVEGALPELADEAWLYVRGSDGRLYRRARARAADERVSADTELGASLPREESHAAALACDAGALVVEEAGGSPPRVIHDLDALLVPGGGGGVVSAALPLWREGDCVGAFHLALAGGRSWSPEEVETLAGMGHAVSLALENARLRREAREARRAKADFLSVMSHELRTPLTAVVGYADLLEAGIPGPVNEAQMTHLARLKESAWSLLELIDGILGYTRYEGAEPHLHVESVTPAELVDAAVAVYRSSLRDKGLELDLDIPRDLPSFRTDKEKAVRILLHVLSNAHKFTDSGAVRVEADADDEWVHVRVRDSGPGIHREDLAEIFEPFWQGQRADTRRHGGTGMGLSLARRLSELLSGRLRVESEVGTGTTVHLSLPREGPGPSWV